MSVEFLTTIVWPVFRTRSLEVLRDAYKSAAQTRGMASRRASKQFKQEQSTCPPLPPYCYPRKIPASLSKPPPGGGADPSRGHRHQYQHTIGSSTQYSPFSIVNPSTSSMSNVQYRAWGAVSAPTQRSGGHCGGSYPRHGMTSTLSPAISRAATSQEGLTARAYTLQQQIRSYSSSSSSSSSTAANNSEFRYKVYKANRRRNQPKYSRVYDPFGEDQTEIRRKISPRTKVVLKLLFAMFLLYHRELLIYYVLPHSGGWFTLQDPYKEEDEYWGERYDIEYQYVPENDGDDLVKISDYFTYDPESSEADDSDEDYDPGSIQEHLVPQRTISQVDQALNEMYPNARRTDLKLSEDKYIRK